MEDNVLTQTETAEPKKKGNPCGLLVRFSRRVQTSLPIPATL